MTDAEAPCAACEDGFDLKFRIHDIRGDLLLCTAVAYGPITARDEKTRAALAAALDTSMPLEEAYREIDRALGIL